MVKDLEKRMDALPEANKVQSPYGTNAGKALVSPDKHSVQVAFEVPGTTEQTKTRVDATLAVTKAVQKDHPDFYVAQFGSASSEKELMNAFEKDLQKAETLSLPITLLILLARVRRARRRRPAPAARPHRRRRHHGPRRPASASYAGLAAPRAASCCWSASPSASTTPCSTSAASVKSASAGAARQQALEIAAATSGRTVLISGLTVMTAMAGLYFAGDAEFAGLATGSILVVAMAMLGSITVLPAMLSKVGDGVDRGRIPFLGKRMQRRTESRFWGAVLRPRHAPPGRRDGPRDVPAGRAVGPALGMHTASSGLEQLPQTPDHEDVRPRAGRVPRHGRPRPGRHQGR